MWKDKLSAGGRILDLSRTELTSLEGLNLPETLLELDLSFTGLKSLAGAQPLAGLRKLILKGAELTSLEGLEQFPGLQELDLQATELKDLRSAPLPAGLKVLNLSNSSLQDLRDVDLPEGLEVLNLSHSNLESLDGAILNPGLQKLDLSSTSLENLEGVTLPVDLLELHMQNTLLKALPVSIRQMNKLKNLDLSGLMLDDLPNWLPELNLPFVSEGSHLGIRLINTEIRGVDMAIFTQSQEMIRDWFSGRGFSIHRKAEAVPLPDSAREQSCDADLLSTAMPSLNELKVVFLGDGEAGKTHTIARLLNDGKQVDTFHGVSTPGIVIEDKTYQIGGRDIKVHFWDFGGQEILHSMHRMFLTKRTLYVVVLNVREGNQQDRARYWLHNLKSFADNAPVLLVLNKMDMNKNASVNEEDLRKLYPMLTEVVKLSTLTYSDKDFLSKFVDVLLREIGAMEILDYPLSPSGYNVKEILQNMTKNYISGSEFQGYCADAHVVNNNAHRRELLELFNELGISFCYSGDGSENLEKYVVLRPGWITNAIYTIIFNKIESVTTGMVSHDTIYRLLSSAGDTTICCVDDNVIYARDEVDYVLNVFRKFRLSFRVADGMEFLPMLCDANATAVAAEYENDPDALEFRMHYEYLPDNVIHRLMVDRYKELDSNNVWLTGAQFTCGDTGRSAVVKSEGNMIRILVRAKKEPRDPQRYLDELKDSLERINTIMGLSVWKMEVAYKADGFTEFFDYAQILMEQELGESKITSLARHQKIWLADVLKQSDFPEDEKQKKLMADIRQACEMLHEDSLYWKANEDQRTGLLAKLLRAKDYIAMEQHRTGISAGGVQSGELDLDIRLTPGDAWSALEALNLKASSNPKTICDNSQIKYWNAHLKKLLDNYNEVGRSFLFHVSYVQCKKDAFGDLCGNLFEHMRFYSPPGFELLRRFTQEIPLKDCEHQKCFIRVYKCVYDCGGIVMTVYHYFVRIGE